LYADFKNTTVAQVSLTKKMMQTIRLGVLSGMQFEEGMFDIIKSLMYLDGMVLRVNPQAVLLKDMRRFIDDFRAVM
jgi:ubiquinone biosynthesis protein